MPSSSRSWLPLLQRCVLANPNQEKMLTSSDPKAVVSKRLVYDFWREVFEG
jgi:hypothetical protein